MCIRDRSVAEGFKDEKACEHLIKIYGSKEKAVEASLKSTGDRDELIKQREDCLLYTSRCV